MIGEDTKRCNRKTVGTVPELDKRIWGAVQLRDDLLAEAVEFETLDLRLNSHRNRGPAQHDDAFRRSFDRLAAQARQRTRLIMSLILASARRMLRRTSLDKRQTIFLGDESETRDRPPASTIGTVSCHKHPGAYTHRVVVVVNRVCAQRRTDI
jgi:hypothetical protein